MTQPKAHDAHRVVHELPAYGQGVGTPGRHVALTVRPRTEWPMFEWHVAHDTDGHLSKVGRVSTATFAKGQAKLALLGLDAKEG